MTRLGHLRRPLAPSPRALAARPDLKDRLALRPLGTKAALRVLCLAQVVVVALVVRQALKGSKGLLLLAVVAAGAALVQMLVRAVRVAELAP
jgi:ABC-type methionine transport system permease subunit